MEDAETAIPTNPSPQTTGTKEESDPPCGGQDGEDVLVREPQRRRPPERPTADLPAPQLVRRIEGADVTVPSARIISLVRSDTRTARSLARVIIMRNRSWVPFGNHPLQVFGDPVGA